MKQLKVGWAERMSTLEDINYDCSDLCNKRGDSYLRVTDIIKHIDGPHILQGFELISSNMLQVELEQKNKKWKRILIASLISL